MGWAVCLQMQRKHENRRINCGKTTSLEFIWKSPKPPRGQVHNLPRAHQGKRKHSRWILYGLLRFLSFIFHFCWKIIRWNSSKAIFLCCFDNSNCFKFTSITAVAAINEANWRNLFSIFENNILTHCICVLPPLTGEARPRGDVWSMVQSMRERRE